MIVTVLDIYIKNTYIPNWRTTFQNKSAVLRRFSIFIGIIKGSLFNDILHNS